MVTAVFTLGLLNLALGCALAVACARFPTWSGPLLRLAFPTYAAAPASSGADSHVTTSDSEPPASASLAEWPARLQAAEVEPASLLESLLWIAKLDTSLFLDELLPLGRTDTLATSQDDFLSRLQSRSAQLEEWLQVFYDNRAALPQGRAANLEELLLDQICQIKASVEALTQSPEESASRQFMLIGDATHAFRDRVDDLLGALLRDEHRVMAVPARYRQIGDSLTFTRLGLEVLFAEWAQRDPERMRLASAAVLDLDHFGQLNQRLGMEQSNAVVDRCADLLHDMIRKDRGFDRIAKISGQRFLIYLGDTSAANALQGAERIRQSIEATSFDVGAEHVELTASLAVTEWKTTEDVGAFLQRLDKCLATAKQTGRNRVCVDHGSGPEFQEVPRYTVTNRTVEVVAKSVA